MKCAESSQLTRPRDSGLVTDLTLDLVQTLNKIPGVQGVNVVVRPGVERGAISTWEQRQAVQLPQTLRALYATTDGISLTWNYSTAGKVLPLGNLEFHPLCRLNRLGSGRGSGDPLAPSATDLALAQEPPSSGQDRSSVGARAAAGAAATTAAKRNQVAQHPPSFSTSRMFEVDSCQGNGRVVLVSPGRGDQVLDGSLWLLDLSLRPHLIAVDVASYWRVMLVHLGMPQWHFLVAGIGLTPWAKQWYSVVAPHLLEGCKPRPPQPDLVNQLDWSAFKPKKINKKLNKDQNKDQKDKKKKEEIEQGK
ncbi:tubulin polyglutamylase complex subunit 2 [Hyalella azteca]|uniref:Tubulin polyglutamylase complex subunit 2 n=1 Tax=Hyalella azteca TaxID=294128 RepID=A0A8B7P6W5_HYAAZ|nr:tubulin polyglutamylase complex subunit 2 [Hyalella azteca]